MDSIKNLIQNYYQSFNEGNIHGMISCLHPEFVHDANEGTRKGGKTEFRKFLNHMNECYKEELKDICIMTDQSGNRASAEFVVHGTYLKTDPGLPEATNQTYVLNAGTFFEIKDHQILRVTTYYNLKDWIKQVS